MQQRRWLVTAALVALLLGTSGCVGFTNYLLWAWKGDKVKAKYPGLTNERVAVVCATKNLSFEPGRDTGTIAREVSNLLEENVEGIELVNADEIADWMDQTNWSQMDYRALGRGVKADKVLAIEFASLTFQDNANEVRGRADYSVSVFDIKSGERKVVHEQPEHVFPSQGPAYVSARAFKTIYIQRLSKEIAQLFYAFDVTESFANDVLAQ